MTEPATTDPSTTGAIDAAGELERLLGSGAPALVSALGPGGKLVPVPAAIPLTTQHVFPGHSAMDVFVGDDKVLVVDAWTRAQDVPIVDCKVRLVATPDVPATVRFFDVREAHGVHVVVLETDAAEDVAATAAAAEPVPTVAHVERDANSVFLSVDDATTALLGWTREELIGRPTLDLLHPDDVEAAIESWLAMRNHDHGAARMQVRFRHAAGHHVWVEVSNENHLDDPDLGCVRSTLVDISAAMAELEALQSRERMLSLLAEALPIGVCHLRSDGRVVHANPPLLELLGPIENLTALTDRVVASDRMVVQLAIDRALEGRAIDLEVGIAHPTGERRCELTFRTMRSDDDGIAGVVVCASDVTDRSRLRAELEHRATHDALSGCLNRAATVAALERSLRERRPVTVAYIDLDRFKAINDELGHAAGDEVLRVAAARLRSVIRSDDQLGRIGGDEFVVICPQGSEPIDLDGFVQRLREAIDGEVSFARQHVALRASIGAAVSDRDDHDAEALLSRADAAMYADKDRHQS